MTRDERILKNLGLVAYVSGKFDHFSSEKEDLLSVGTIGLIKAADTYEETRNVKFSTYAVKCIENEIISYLRKNEEQTKYRISLEDETVIIDSNEGRQEEYVCLCKAIAELDEIEQKLLAVRFGLERSKNENMTQEEAAVYLGISQSTFSRWERRIIEKLRRSMLEEGEGKFV